MTDQSFSSTDINLKKALRPLQMIAVLTVLVFVLNFTLEVLVMYETTYIRLLLVLILITTLSCWALIESILVARQKLAEPFKWLNIFLLGQVLFPIIRSILLAQSTSSTNLEWFLHVEARDKFHFFALVPASLLFLAIEKTIIDLFTLNQKNRAVSVERQMLQTLNALALARDNETGNHIIRTQNYVKQLALRLRSMGYCKDQLDDKNIDLLFKSAPLHDLGKVGIPDHILHKSGRLTEEEWEIMKTHTTIGENVLSSTEDELQADGGIVKKAIEIAGGHHEKWDGTGYPRALKGEQIPLPARIMALADVYDALVSERVYKEGWSHERAIEEIVAKRGTHFDPTVVDAFIAEKDQFNAIAQRYKDN